METSVNVISQVVVFIAFAFFMKNLVDLLRSIRPENRVVNPHVVWLMLLFFLKILLAIPFKRSLVNYDYYFVLVDIQYAVILFMSLFQIYLVIRVADSVTAEYTSRRISCVRKPTLIAGICMCISYILIPLCFFIKNTYISNAVGFIYVVSIIVYWVQTNKVKKKLNKTFLKIDSFGDDSIFKDL